MTVGSIIGQPCGSPMSSDGLPWESGGGGGSWLPSASPVVIEYFLFNDLAAGAVSSWVGKKAGWNLSQGTGAKQPTASQTSFNSRPGLTFDGGDCLQLAALNLSAHSSLRIVFCAIDTATTNSVIMEFGADYSAANGRWYFGVNGATNAEINVGARGTVNLGAISAAEALASAKVVSLCPDTSQVTGCRFVRVNGSSISLTPLVSTCGPGAFSASDTLNVGSRNNAASLGWTGTMGGALIVMSGTAQDNDLLSAESYARALAGL